MYYLLLDIYLHHIMEMEMKIAYAFNDSYASKIQVE